MLLPSTSNMALKEWAVADRALGGGRQILILRKGGIHRDDKDFRIVHPEFLLYPTYEHQKPELLKPRHVAEVGATENGDSGADLVTFTHWCRVTDRFELQSEGELAAISEFHMWTDDYAEKRLHWRPKQPLTVALLRVYRLQQPQSLPVLDEHSGCKSWVELGPEVPLGDLTPALSDSEYEDRADEIRGVLGAAPTPV
ncbi:MAG: DUF1802 family protein [SAR202 cluster bacterium]|nr:DUF1802 family protein [SAR202 cluster bacterium]